MSLSRGGDAPWCVESMEYGVIGVMMEYGVIGVMMAVKQRQHLRTLSKKKESKTG